MKFYYQVQQGGMIFQTKRAAMTAAKRVKRSSGGRPVPVLIVSVSGESSLLCVI